MEDEVLQRCRGREWDVFLHTDGGVREEGAAPAWVITAVESDRSKDPEEYILEMARQKLEGVTPFMAEIIAMEEGTRRLRWHIRGLLGKEPDGGISG